MSRKEPFLNTREEEVLDDTVTGYEYEGIIKSPDTQSVNSKRADTLEFGLISIAKAR